jgi:lactate dehydrogenase-like 2-hydroxyacid dehydrogenase
MSEEIGEATADLLKEMVEEIRTLRKRVEQLESNNNSLIKAVDNPETMMKKAGWLKAVTPLAEETFDPLNRSGNDEQVFGFNQDMISKSTSRDDELHEWRQMEQAIPTPSSPSAKTYR